MLHDVMRYIRAAFKAGAAAHAGRCLFRISCCFRISVYTDEIRPRLITLMLPAGIKALFDAALGSRWVVRWVRMSVCACANVCSIQKPYFASDSPSDILLSPLSTHIATVTKHQQLRPLVEEEERKTVEFHCELKRRKLMQMAADVSGGLDVDGHDGGGRGGGVGMSMGMRGWGGGGRKPVVNETYICEVLSRPSIPGLCVVRIEWSLRRAYHGNNCPHKT